MDTLFHLVLSCSWCSCQLGYCQNCKNGLVMGSVFQRGWFLCLYMYIYIYICTFVFCYDDSRTYPQTSFVFCYDDSRTCPKCLSIVLGDLGAISVTAAGKDADLVQESENLVGLV